MKINDIQVTGLTQDSRQVRPGWAFFAIKGRDQDGTKYISDATARGAAIIVTDENYKGPSFKVPDIRKFLTECAIEFFSPLPENIIAVTGTSGKTSVTHFCKYILENLGKDVATIGTFGLVHRGMTVEMDQGATTPNPVQLCHVLSILKRQGCEYVVIEATSQAMAQDRMTGIHVKAAGFTNLSRDHISDREHKDMDDYFAAKKKLFSVVLAKDGTAILNADSDWFHGFDGLDRKVVSYGKTGKNIILLDSRLEGDQQIVTLAINGQIYSYSIAAKGNYQVYNSMCAIGMVMGLGFDATDVIKATNGAQASPGRLQYVGTTKTGGQVYLDYAHTYNQVVNVLTAARGFCKGRLVTVAAASGERGMDRRIGMGKANHEMADVVYVTDDSPRSESAEQIRADVIKACPSAIEVPGRGQAIARAMADLQDGDILVILNKGHETFVQYGQKMLPWSDTEEVLKNLQALQS